VQRLVPDNSEKKNAGEIKNIYISLENGSKIIRYPTLFYTEK